MQKNWKTRYCQLVGGFFLEKILPVWAFLGLFMTPLWAQQQEPHDGRFTLGSKSQTFLFGYPYHFSSSHFVIGSNGKYASNNPDLKQVVDLEGNPLIAEHPHARGSQVGSLRYTFDNLQITQSLIPTNEKFEPIGKGEYGSFYEIRYEIENHSDIEREVSFSMLLDVMLGGNDGVKIEADGRVVKMDECFFGEKVPHRFIFQDADLRAHLFTRVGKAIAPDKICAGQWAYLAGVVDFETQTVEQYTDDTALMLTWDTKTLAPKEKRVCSFYFGSLSEQTELQFQYHKPLRKEQITLFFGSGESTLSETEEQKLRELIGSRRYKAVLVEGFTDSVGDRKRNLELSKDRIDNVSYHLQMCGISFEKILRKSHGQFFALEGSQGADQDRKVVVTFWK
ncbi:OmpA family protein [Hugenholtzia roseola]|uniref:OmpA family protein n=1 Tax=Hugenholtzia roseola TaxID=1002 RepID=UPI0003F8E84F|nr:OmpA family protein [Hugenholtzia roseola]